ncbi:MAG: 2-C-methyl-D-erythritol 4-phosphate cytidylyltransferase [Thermodesulfobacteriota bacterium]
MANIKASAIITAGGAGTRFASKGAPKQFAALLDKPILVYSTQSFQSSDHISEIVLVVPKGWEEHTQKEIVERYNLSKVSNIVAGGAQRQDSVQRGLKSITSNPDIVAVHDGVRPFVTTKLIEEVLSEASRFGGAIAAAPSIDTIKQSGTDDLISTTLPREKIWLAQTPQAFKYDILVKAYEKAAQDEYIGTDESILVERIGKQVALVSASKYNIKITTPNDIKLGEFILKSKIFENKQEL